jgi:hypothetical protein
MSFHEEMTRPMSATIQGMMNGKERKGNAVIKNTWHRGIYKFNEIDSDLSIFHEFFS